MTCIVGVIENEKVVIGGDSAGVAGLDICTRKDPKVFRNGDFLIGCTSSFRMIQLLRFSFTPPQIKENADVYEYMCTDFINAVRECFKNGGYAEINLSVEKGGSFLVGYRSRLFCVENDFQVGEYADDCIAIGCGESFALGALSALSKDIGGSDRVRQALAVAEHLSAGVRGPFVIETL